MGLTQSMNEPLNSPTIAKNGWTLVSAEERALAYPERFQIPPLAERQSLSPGDAAKLLFDIETKENGCVIDRGVDRMWVIIKASTDSGYLGILDNDPGIAENLTLRQGDRVLFGSQHVIDTGRPPHDYILGKYSSIVLRRLILTRRFHAYDWLNFSVGSIT
jgi:hypothetical protein